MKNIYKTDIFFKLRYSDFLTYIERQSFCENFYNDEFFNYDLSLKDDDGTDLNINIVSGSIYDICKINFYYNKYKILETNIRTETIDIVETNVNDKDTEKIFDYFFKFLEKVVCNYENDKQKNLKKLLFKAEKYSKTKDFNL